MSAPTSIWQRLKGLLGGKQSKVPAEPSPEKVATAPTAPPFAKVSAPPVDLVLGIDFGTSCTKVVIGDPGWKNDCFAVSFNSNGKGLSGWLYPTRFQSEANLKMRLMDNPGSLPMRDIVACYLAEVIKHSRLWFTNHGPSAYVQRPCNWSLNLGFAGKKTTGSPLAEAYRAMADIAVKLASLPGESTPEIAAKLRLGTVNVDNPIIPSSRIHLYPEIAAQLAGYVNSPHVKRGNLLLIDVGAGTLDVSTIILHASNEEDVVSFHVCEVESLGALRLFQERSNALTEIQPGSVAEKLEDFQDGLRPIPDTLEAMLSRNSRRSQALAEAFASVSNDFASEVVRIPMSCLSRFKNVQQEAHENGTAFDPWGKTLRYFLTGGGSRSAFYRRQIAADGPLEHEFARITRWHHERERRKAARQGLLLEEMPRPDNLKNFPPSLAIHFDRLSVAYGLAYGGQNLMRVTALGDH